MKSCRLLSMLVFVLTLLPLGKAIHSESPEAFIARMTAPTVSRSGVSATASEEPTCPDLIVGPDEECDDGNSSNGDGCDTTCHYEPAICGNGVLDPGEECDDGNLVANDGCDPACGLEPAVCGNGVLDFEEECDDGNTASGDGCDAACRLEGLTGVQLYVVTSTGNDTLYQGVSGSLIFRVVAPETTQIANFTYPMEYNFSTENLIGPIGFGSGAAFMTYSPKAHATVSFVGWNRGHAMADTNPAATLLGMTRIFNDPWTGSGEVWRITFVPRDTGTITIDSTTLPPQNSLSILSPEVAEIPYEWHAKTVTVVAGLPTGNVNGDEVTSSADLVYMVNYLYREGIQPERCIAVGDVDCSGSIDVLDIMRNINYVFKNGQRPCNVAGLVGAGVWECP